MHLFDPSPLSNIGLREVNLVSLKRGIEGDTENPLRDVYQYWSKKGYFLAEFDPIHYPGFEEYSQPNHPTQGKRKEAINALPEDYSSCTP